MWPKAFAQLIELAPHVSRLLPMADRFFQSKNATDDATRRAVDARADELRGEMRALAAAQLTMARQLDPLIRQLDGLGKAVASSAEEGRLTRVATEAVQVRLGSLETRFGGVETRLEQARERGGTGPVVLLLVLTNLILLACTIALLVHRR